MNKPMKRFTNGVLNYNAKSIKPSSSFSRAKSGNTMDMQELISKRSKEKAIKDSRLDKKEEIDSKTERNQQIDSKKEDAKELLNIQKTSDKKGSNLDNYSLEYKDKHQLRYYSRSEQNENTTPEGFEIDDVFRDL